MIDFTTTTHQALIATLKKAGYSFYRFSEYIVSKAKNEFKNFHSSEYQFVILRHDVEQRYENALQLARIQAGEGVKGTYFFRILPHCYKPEIVKEIAAMGHEVGYHYDDLAACNGNMPKAIERFRQNLNTLRQIAPVTSISMDGSPLSRHDNRKLWEQYNYHDLGIHAEPYFDLDFNQIFYLTDTGRCWDGHRFNVRDKATKENPITNPNFLTLNYHTTFDIIHALQQQTTNKEQRTTNKEQRTKNNEQKTTNKEQRTTNNEHFDLLRLRSATIAQCPEIEQQTTNNEQKTTNKEQRTTNLPHKIMFTFHPQRWSDNWFLWSKEFVLQNAKNQVKRFLVKTR